MEIKFAPEAYETFQRLAASMEGYVIDITPEDGSEPFEGVIVGYPQDAEWYDAIRVRRVNEHYEPVGDPFDIRVESIEVA